MMAKSVSPLEIITEFEFFLYYQKWPLQIKTILNEVDQVISVNDIRNRNTIKIKKLHDIPEEQMTYH